MAKIRNKKTGQIIEVPEEQLSSYGVNRGRNESHFYPKQKKDEIKPYNAGPLGLLGAIGGSKAGPLGTFAGNLGGKTMERIMQPIIADFKGEERPKGIQNWDELKQELGGDLKSSAGAAATDLAFKGVSKLATPIKTLGKIRDTKIAKAGIDDIPYKKVLLKLMKKFDDVPTSHRKTFQKLLDDDVARLGKSTTSLKELEKIKSTAGKTAYTEGGKVGKAANAAYEKAKADAIREIIEEQAPNVSKVDKTMSKVYKGKKLGKDILKKLIPYFIVGKLLKMGGGSY